LALSRRFLLASGAAGLAVSAARPALAMADTNAGVSPALLRRALGALQKHQDSITHRDVIAIADFSQPSRARRFHLLDVASGAVASHLVAHGRGSDPAHTGWLERFSNVPSSNATSAGAYRTEGFYVGGHGRSIRLSGLDASNCNAESRAIVVHGAWYVSNEMARESGVLGRSQGCFALANTSLDEIFAKLGPGRMIYADKV
jgi:hypothetical protein